MTSSHSAHKRRGSTIVRDDEKVQSAKGYSIDLFKNKTYALQYQCVICKEICKNPVELACADETDYDSTESDVDNLYNHDVLYCESCLSVNLSTNNNQCPINPKHLKTNYNIARNIRKQINNLYVYCANKQLTNAEGDNNNKGCKWEGKLSKLNAHLKTCKCNTEIYCDICNKICTESTLLEHNAYNIIKHINLLHKQSLEKHVNDEELAAVNNNIAQINDDFAIKIEQQITDLTSINDKLKQEIKILKKEFNNWKIAFNIENSKKEIKLKRLLKKQKDSIALLQTQNKQLKDRFDSEIISAEKFNTKHKKLQNEIDKLKKIMQLKSSVSIRIPKISKKKNTKDTKVTKSIKSKKPKHHLSLRRTKSKPAESLKKAYLSLTPTVSCKVHKKKRKKSAGIEKGKRNNTDTDLELPENPKLNNSAKSVPFSKLSAHIPMLKRTSSMKGFHPDGVEWFHPKGIHYEMIHTKKSIEVWVSKTMGQMSKLYRYPCCGSAKEGPLYLKPTDDNKNVNEALFVVGTEKDIPDNWNDDMHLGCTENKKKNKKNMSYYKCCEKDIMNVGCKQRYKCCKEEYHTDNESDGCKVGWSC